MEFTLDRGSTPLASIMINFFIAITIFTNTCIVNPVHTILKNKTGISFCQACLYICNEEEKEITIIHHSKDYRVMYFSIENKDWYVDLDKKEIKRKRLDFHLIIFK